MISMRFFLALGCAASSLMILCACDGEPPPTVRLSTDPDAEDASAPGDAAVDPQDAPADVAEDGAGDDAAPDDSGDPGDVGDVADPADAEPDALISDVPDAPDPLDAAEDAPDDAEPDAPEPPLAGLDGRPVNATCLAGARPPVGRVRVRVERAFPNLTFNLPLAMEQAPGDSAWFVMEKSGRILKFDDDPGASTFTTVLDIRDRVLFSATRINDERGLLGMAFHPRFADNGEVYVSYNASSGGRTLSRVSRFTGDARQLSPDSEEILIEFVQPATNHNGGDLKFGPDGLLYISFGDGGGSGDTFNNGQNIDNLFAAILRIDVDARRGLEPPYGIPPDNPFAGGGGAPEIFAWGLRNVWRFSFDTATGDLWAADVGQNAIEEVDLILNGGNYGWPIKEGRQCFANNPLCDQDGLLVDPVASYTHAEGRSITGGYVYRGASIPALVGAFLYGDFATGRIFALLHDEDGDPDPQVIVDTSLAVASFGQDRSGEVYVLSYLDGGIYKIVPDTAPPGAAFPERLSLTGCVDPDDPALPSEGMIPYGVNVPFWSDEAEKERWFALPDGARIEVEEDGDLDLPVGAVTMKHFRLGDQLIETRLFVRHDDGGWAGYSYAWDEAQTDAILLPAGQTRQIGDRRWLHPSRPQCVVCHTEAAGRTLGLEVIQLNGDLTYPGTGRTANQLDTLQAIGVLAPLGDLPGALGALPRIDEVASDAERARAWLHSNCSACHRPGGAARGDLDMRWEAATLIDALCEIPPEFGDLGIPDARLVVPGDPARSILWARVARRDVHGMPPLGSAIIDPIGLDLLAAWIEGDPCGDLP